MTSCTTGCASPPGDSDCAGSRRTSSPRSRVEGATDLTIIGNNAGVDGFGMGLLLDRHHVRHVVASYVGENREFERQILNHEISLDLVPQGTLAERLRAGGAGIPAFFTPTAAGTDLAAGREARTFGGGTYVLEEASGRTCPWSRRGRGTRPATSSTADRAQLQPDDRSLRRRHRGRGRAAGDGRHAGSGRDRYPGIYVDRIVRARVYEKPGRVPDNVCESRCGRAVRGPRRLVT